jgi:hypothetical protein
MRASKDIEGEWKIREEFIRKPAMSKITLDLDQVSFIIVTNLPQSQSENILFHDKHFNYSFCLAKAWPS